MNEFVDESLLTQIEAMDKLYGGLTAELGNLAAPKLITLAVAHAISTSSAEQVRQVLFALYTQLSNRTKEH